MMSFIHKVHGKPKLHVSANLLFRAWPPCCAIPPSSPLCAQASKTASHDNHEKINSWVPLFSMGLGLRLAAFGRRRSAMINWHLSNQGIRWPVSRDHIAGSSLWLIEVTCFIKVDRWSNAGFQLDRGLMSSKLVENRAGLRKPVNSNPGLKLNQIITVSFLQMLCLQLLICDY